MNYLKTLPKPPYFPEFYSGKNEEMIYNIEMFQNISFTNCLSTYFNDTFNDTLKEYVENGTFKKDMGWEEKDILSYEGPLRKRTKVLRTNGAEVIFFAQFFFEYTRNGESSSIDESQHSVSSVCSWNIPLKEKGLTMQGIKVDQPKPESEWTYDESLVPIVRKNEYPKMAELFRKKVFGDEEIETVGYMYALDVIERLGLNLISYSLPHACTGKIFMVDSTLRLQEADGTFKEKPVKAGTILFDQNKAIMMSPSMMATTPLHESFHWVFHRCAFELGRLYRQTDDGFLCFEGNTIKGSKAAEGSKFIEIQTNGVIPYITIDTEELEKSAREISNEYRNSGMTKPEALEMTLDELRGIYNMSVESMRRCLLERGFTAFRGIKIFQDDGYLQSYCFKREALKENETFCLPRAEMSRLFKEDQYIRSLILDGSYVYVDGHLVLRDPEYVSFRDLVTPELTPKALSNADECFMVFSVTKPQGSSVKFEDSLNRTPKKMEATYKALRDPKAKPKERAEARQKWNEYIKEWRACERATFGETFKAIMKYKKKPAHFFEGYGLSEDQVYNLYKNENRPNIQSVVVIGGRLNMPYEIFIPFVEQAGFDPYSTLKGMPAYLDFMDDANLFKDISEFNDMLIENGYTSLFKPTKAK